MRGSGPHRILGESGRALSPRVLRPLALPGEWPLTVHFLLFSSYSLATGLARPQEPLPGQGAFHGHPVLPPPRLWHPLPDALGGRLCVAEEEGREGGREGGKWRLEARGWCLRRERRDVSKGRRGKGRREEGRGSEFKSFEKTSKSMQQRQAMVDGTNIVLS